MRWPRVARNSIETDLDVARKDSNDNATQDASSSYDQLTLKSANPTGLSRMFSDAALYEKVLNACPETLKNGVFHFSADDESLPNCLGGFNQLIGRDLDDAERVVTGKLATLSVNTWASSIDDPFGADTPSEEERGEISSSDEGEDKKQAPLSAAPASSDSEEPPSEPKLTPEEVVELFELEFGALAAPGEEKLLLETDAALLRDVIVLVGPPHPLSLYLFTADLHFPAIVQGVVHLTTHRFTFHASLLSTQPGDSQNIVKSGSALVHRKGWRRKRKVWLQLDRDMVSSFPSSRDEDRIKPLRSILCLYPKIYNRYSSFDLDLQYPRSRKSSPSTGSDRGSLVSSSSRSMVSPKQ